MTELSGGATINTLDDFLFGSVGKPGPGVELKVADDGEICVRGGIVMQEYWRKPEVTTETIDSEGWLHSGDVGHVDDEGFVHITDRIKELIVTAGGKNIAPQPIETKLAINQYVTQVVVVGDRRPYLSALVVPNFEALDGFAASHGLQGADPATLVASPVVQDLFQRQIEQLNADLPGFSQVKKISLLERELTLEAGELTPTMKIKRFAVARIYRDVIRGMYPTELPGEED